MPSLSGRLPCTKRPQTRTRQRARSIGWNKRFGALAYHRFTTAYRYFEHVHQRCMPSPHWYLALLGVSPECQGQSIGRALLTAGLQRADEQELLCYLETFVPKNVAIYERFGFYVVDAGTEPHSQIAFWAMKREPRVRNGYRTGPRHGTYF